MEEKINKIKKLFQHEGFVKYFKNTSWMFAGKFLSIIVAFFVGAYIARYLGPTKYGILSYVMSFSGLFGVLSNLGIDTILNKELINYPEKKNSLLGSAFIMKILGSFLSVLLIIFTLIITKADKTIFIFITITTITFFLNSFLVIDNYFQANILAQKTVKIQIISLLLITVFKILFIYLKLDIIWFIFISIIDTLIITIGLIVSYKNMDFYILDWKFDYFTIINLIKKTWPMTLSIISIAIFMKIDQIIIKNMIGNEATGIYAVAVKISEIWYFIPSIICASLFPAIINAKKTNQKIYKNRLQKLYALMFYLSLGIAIIISLTSNFIIIKLFGVDYTESIFILKIHIWAGVGIFLGYAITQYLIAENFTKIFLITQIIGVVLNISLNILLIPVLGIRGAAIATLFSYTLSNFSIILFKKTRPQILLIINSLNIFKKYKENI